MTDHLRVGRPSAMTRSGLHVGRPWGTSPGWVVYHNDSGRYAIQPVRYKRDADAAMSDLYDLDVDWTQTTIPHSDLMKARDVYNKYAALRQRQLANNRYWPRPKN